MTKTEMSEERLNDDVELSKDIVGGGQYRGTFCTGTDITFQNCTVNVVPVLLDGYVKFAFDLHPNRTNLTHNCYNYHFNDLKMDCMAANEILQGLLLA